MTKNHKILIAVAVLAVVSLTVAYAVNGGVGKVADSGACPKVNCSLKAEGLCDGDLANCPLANCPKTAGMACPKATGMACPKTAGCDMAKGCPMKDACCCKDDCKCCDGCKDGDCTCDDCQCCDCCKK